jgi:hypothetical protein
MKITSVALLPAMTVPAPLVFCSKIRRLYALRATGELAAPRNAAPFTTA